MLEFTEIITLSNLTEDSELNQLIPTQTQNIKIENFFNFKKDKIDYTILRYFNVAGADKEKIWTYCKVIYKSN